MLDHLFGILGLVALCAGWVLFQEWLKRVDPEKGNFKAGCAGCGSCSCESEKEKTVS
jgi:hypothetical protein